MGSIGQEWVKVSKGNVAKEFLSILRFYKELDISFRFTVFHGAEINFFASFMIIKFLVTSSCFLRLSKCS